MEEDKLDVVKYPFYLYYYENVVNGKMYIGKGRRRRYAIHINIAKTNGDGKKYGIQYRHLHKSINKYGIENFKYGIFAYYSNEDEAYEAEEFWINYLMEQGIVLYNTAIGGRRGQTGLKRTEETKNKISKAHMGKVLTEEHIANMSKSLKGRLAPNKGKKGNKLSDETKNKISSSLMNNDRKRKRRFTEDQENEICRLYDIEKKEMHELKNIYECCHTLINNILKRNKIAKRPSPKQRIENNGRRKFTKEEEKAICDDFVVGKGGLSVFGVKYKCGKTTIRRILKSNNIDLKIRKYK